MEPGVDPNRWRLSERGRRRSVLLGEELGRYGPGVLVSSEEPKAAETARVAARGLGVEHATAPGLHEHDRLNAPFLGDEAFRRTARHFFDRPGELVWGNETAEGALARFEGAVGAVLDARDEDVVVVVAHGTVISLFIAKYNDVEPYELWRRLGLPSLCVLTVPGFGMRGSIYDLTPEA